MQTEITAQRKASTARARPMQIRTLEINGQRLRVAVWPGESTDRPPLLLCNGIGVGLELLAPLAESLSGLEIIAFDVPGAGQSPPPNKPYRLWMMARLVSRMLDELGYGQVDVLGISWGGTLAQQFALQNRRRCRRLILVATLQGVPLIPPSLAVLWKFATPRRFNDAEFRRKVAGEMYGGALRVQPELVGGLDALYSRVNRHGYLFQQFALWGWTSVPWLPLLPQRTLIMAGRDDPVVPLINAHLMARLMRRSQLHIHDDGHLYLVTSAAASGRVVEEFLQAA